MKEFKIKSHMVSRSRIWLKMVSITSPLLSDKIYLNLIYHHCYGKWINWENPQTFNEKVTTQHPLRMSSFLTVLRQQVLH